METQVTRSSDIKTAGSPTETSKTSPSVGLVSPAARAFRLKQILVPVDFSPCSKKALAYAVSFAKQFGAELTLLHVVQPFTPVPEMPPVDFETVNEAKAELDALHAAIGPGLASKAVLRTGPAHAEIVRAAKEIDADLIIISTHGRTGLTRVLMGSTTERVVRLAGCPVLVVREFEHEFIAE